METFRNNGDSFKAVRFTRESFKELWDFTKGAVSELSIKSEEPGDAICILKSQYGSITIKEGDYVFPDVSGKIFYANPPEQFELTNKRVFMEFEPPVEEQPVK